MMSQLFRSIGYFPLLIAYIEPSGAMKLDLKEEAVRSDEAQNF